MENILVNIILNDFILNCQQRNVVTFRLSCDEKINFIQTYILNLTLIIVLGMQEQIVSTIGKIWLQQSIHFSMDTGSVLPETSEHDHEM